MEMEVTTQITIPHGLTYVINFFLIVMGPAIFVIGETCDPSGPITGPFFSDCSDWSKSSQSESFPEIFPTGLNKEKD